MSLTAPAPTPSSASALPRSHSHAQPTAASRRSASSVSSKRAATAGGKRSAARGGSAASAAAASTSPRPNSVSPVASNSPNGSDGVLDEKRIKFLERNRAAATRCREKKKQWLQQLQQRANTLTTGNKQMYSEMSRLREEVSALRALLIQQQGADALSRAGVALSEFSDPNFDLKKYATSAAPKDKAKAKGAPKK